MGLQFYIGASGSGKSYILYERIIAEALREPHTNYLVVVPDQFTMQTQLEMVKKHPNRGIMNIDVLSFGRLSHRIFEETGGNGRPVLDDTGKSLVLRRVAASLEDQLGVMRRNIKKPGYISEVKSALSEFMQYGIGASDLEKLCAYAAGRGALVHKLRDLHTLYKGFLEYINERYITTEETLDILSRVLPRSKVVRDSVVVFDGFTGFTPVQYNVIQELMIHARRVIVTVTADVREDVYIQDGEQKLFYLSKKTVRDLDRRCREVGARREPDVKIEDGIARRFINNAGLAHLERELFRYPYREYSGTQENIHIFEASNPQEELRQVCLEIRRLVRERHYCYRDIAIVTGDLDRYGFAAREIFGRFDIPYFLDQTNRLVLNPFIEFIRSALLVVIQEYSYESVFHFLRCGMAGVAPDDVDRLENYCLYMGIRGKKAWGNKFTRRMKRHDDEARELERLDEMREKIVAMLGPLMAKRTGKATGAELVRALYAFIVNASIEEKLAEYEQKFTDGGDHVRAKEYAQIYRLVMGLLEQICGLLGEEELDIKEFAGILDAGFAEIKVGTIPQTVDKVVIGDIERTRLGEVKVLFFIGVNDGIIPKSGGTGGIISDIDREFLQQSEYELAPTPRQQMYIQRLYLYLMMTKPSELLYLSYAKVDSEGKSIRPAYLVNTVSKLFPDIKITRPELRPVEEQTESAADALSYLVELLRRYAADNIGEDKRLFVTLYDTYAGNEKYAPLLEQMRHAAFSYLSGAGGLRLPRELAQLLYGHVLKNSVSRLERFASCAYAYFLQYGLSLEERDKYGFESVDMGNIFHAVLESFADRLAGEGYTWFDFPKDEGERIVGECLEEYAASYGETILYSSRRNEYMITRMRRILNRTVQTLQYQIKKGSFAPEHFELSFQMASDLDSVNILLSDEERMHLLIGRIDRVDTCQKDDKLYVKVIDYKSGNRKFDLAALYYGLQLQLVVYMNAAVEVQKKKLEGEKSNVRVIPAAMLYYHVSDPVTETDKGNPDIAEIEAAILDELKMTGMVSDDEEVIRLLDRDFETKSTVIPVARKKDGSFTKASNVLSEDDFKAVSDFVNHKIKELGVSILEGDIGLNPYVQKDAEACTYCAYKGICGFDRKLGEGLVRHLDEMDNDGAMERIRESLKKSGGVE